MSNELVTPLILNCPAEFYRAAAPNFTSFKNENLSYFVGANAEFRRPGSILAGDRNITNDVVRSPTIVRQPLGTRIRWTKELHHRKGNLLFADAHVEERNGDQSFASGFIGDLILPSAHTVNSLACPPIPPQTPRAPAGSATSNHSDSPVADRQEHSRSSDSKTFDVRQQRTSSEVVLEESAIKPATNPIEVAAAPSTNAQQSEPVIEKNWSSGSAVERIRNSSWLLYLLLALIAAVLIALRLRQRAKKQTE
jgi:prepilin-type processing-associated H-X9-DG protein